MPFSLISTPFTFSFFIQQFHFKHNLKSHKFLLPYGINYNKSINQQLQIRRGAIYCAAASTNKSLRRTDDRSSVSSVSAQFFKSLPYWRPIDKVMGVALKSRRNLHHFQDFQETFSEKNFDSLIKTTEPIIKSQTNKNKLKVINIKLHVKKLMKKTSRASIN